MPSLKVAFPRGRAACPAPERVPFPVRFQVTEETSLVLQTLGYTCTCRGVINVKGKGELKTYFVNTEMSGSLSQSNLAA